MPSVTDSSWKPASASSSVADSYSARPLAASCGVLGADARVVEAGADRVRLEDLAVLVLEEERPRAVQHARARPGSPTRRAGPISSPRPPASTPTSARVGVEEAGERADRVRAAADARDDEVGVVAAEDRAALLARLVADDALELAHHPRVRVRADDRADAVVRASRPSRPSRAAPR